MTAVTMDRPRCSPRGEDLRAPARMLVIPSPSEFLSDDDIEYEEIEDTDNVASFPSDEEDIAEYWDPYRKLLHVLAYSDDE